MSNARSLHTYVARPASQGASAAPTLLLLHGTGGDEHDLISLGQRVAPSFNMLSPRGNVLENGMPRFFRRLREGVFDLADLERRTGELARWIPDACAHEGFDPARVIALGYSNGANIAANVLLRQPGVLKGAALLRAMVTNPEPGLHQPGSTPVLLVSGAWDAIVPADNADRLARMLEASGCDVRHARRAASHALDVGDADTVEEWVGTISNQNVL